MKGARWKALPVAVAASVALLGSATAQPRVRPAPKPLLGVVVDRYQPQQRESLVRVNRRTLRPVLGYRIPLTGLYAGAWSYSPDGRTLALGLQDADTPSLLFVDRSRLEVDRTIYLRRGSLSAVDWLAPDRLAIVADRGSLRPPELIVIDPVVNSARQESITGDVVDVARGAGKLVVLVAAQGSSRLLVVDATGAARYVALEGIEAQRGALAVQPDGRRAFVVAPNGLAADVDLTTFAVSRHQVAAGLRTARVLPNGLLALSGWTSRPCRTGGTSGEERVPAGLHLVDTSTWAMRTIDPTAGYFTVGGRALLAGGSRGCRINGFYVKLGAKQSPARRGYGLSAYTFTGHRRFVRFRRSEAFVLQVYGRRAFVANIGRPLAVVDLRTGRLVGWRTLDALPVLLVGRSGAAG